MEVKDIFLLCYFQGLSILLFKGFFSCGPNFFGSKILLQLMFKYKQNLETICKNILPTKHDHSSINFQITLSTYKHLRKSEVVVLIYAGGSMLVFCL